MKASALIEKLQALMAEHGDLEVVTQGCDCDGDSHCVTWEPPHKILPEQFPATFYIRRESP